MSARHPVTVGHDAYDAALAAGRTPAEASLASVVAREAAYGHPDPHERAELLEAIAVQAFAQGHLLGAAEHVVGLRDRALSDGTVPTMRLREALATLWGDVT